jgi:hypothetical protein
MESRAWMIFLIGICFQSSATDNMSSAPGEAVAWVLQSDRELIIAADSRKVYSGNESPKDDECKIVRLGRDALFASWGSTSLENAYTHSYVAISNDFARDAFRAYPNDPHKMADFWGQRMLKAVLTLGMPDQFRDGESSIATGLFAADDGALIDTWEVAIVNENGILTTDIGRLESFGEELYSTAFKDDMREFVLGRSARALRLRNEILAQFKSDRTPIELEALMLGGAVRAVEDWENAPDVGGPVDIAVLEVRQPFQWIRHKSMCRQSDPEALVKLKRLMGRSYPVKQK